MKIRLFACSCLVTLTLGAGALADPLVPNIPAQPSAAEVAALAAQGAKPGDDALTCEQIGAEMQPYAQAMMPTAMALGDTAQQIQDYGDKQKAAAAGQMGLGMAAGVAASLLPGGGFIAQAQMAAQANQMRQRAAEVQPLRDKMMAQTGDLAAQMAPMQQEPRFQRLMQLAEVKCKDMQR